MKTCDIKNCKQEPTAFILTDKLTGQFDMKGKAEFYFCYDHLIEINDTKDETISFLNYETGKLEEIELISYCSGKNCNCGSHND